MTDPVDRFFEREREAVPTLSPPPGLFDELQTVARRKRNRNTTMVSAAAAVVLAVVGTGAVLGAQSLGGTSTNAEKPGGPYRKGLGSASVHAHRDLDPRVDPTVPADFTAWSVSFVGTAGTRVGPRRLLLRRAAVRRSCSETTDGLASWHTLAKPGHATAVRRSSAGHATVRFQSLNDGWMVGSRRCLRDPRRRAGLAPVAALQSAGIDALEAWKSHVYAVGAQGSVLWVSEDPTSDTWLPQPGLDLPPAGARHQGQHLARGPRGRAVVALHRRPRRRCGFSTDLRQRLEDRRHLPARRATAVRAAVRHARSHGQPVRLRRRQVYGRLVRRQDAEARRHVPPHVDDGQAGRRGVGGSRDGTDTVVAYQGAGCRRSRVGQDDQHPTPATSATWASRQTARASRSMPPVTDAYWITANGGRPGTRSRSAERVTGS